MQASKETLLWMFEKMVEIRHFEETMVNVYLEGKLPPQHQAMIEADPELRRVFRQAVASFEGIAGGMATGRYASLLAALDDISEEIPISSEDNKLLAKKAREIHRRLRRE